MGRIWFGTSSWSEKGWIGPFYPPGTAPREMLPFYATQFPAVEADVTYYRIPSRTMVADWAARTGEGFLIASKFPREIVHGGEGSTPDPTKVLLWARVGAAAEAFIDVMRGLGETLGPMIIQCPYYNKSVFDSQNAFLERLNGFLERLPDDLRFGIELRNRNYLTADLMAILETHRVSLVWADIPYMPPPWQYADAIRRPTASFRYVRLIGDRKATEALTETFSEIVIDRSGQIREWARFISGECDRFEDIFVFANNHFAGFGPATIREFIQALAEIRGGLE